MPLEWLGDGGERQGGGWEQDAQPSPKGETEAQSWHNWHLKWDAQLQLGKLRHRDDTMGI